jgi:pSer/pThr/pTyr-binding forkhead associated (FHA) protein
MWRLVARDRDNREVACVDLSVEGDEILIGRDPTAPIHLEAASVSRRHARVILVGGKLLLYDESSMGGVRVGGAKISGRARLHAGSRLQIAEFTIDVMETPSARTATVRVNVHLSRVLLLAGLVLLVGLVVIALFQRARAR